MTNIRVYELSRDLDKPSKEILNVAKGLGISVKSHASSISAEEAKKITDKIGAKSSAESQAQKNPIEEEEKVRVFRSESGAEVVERRKGSRVVLRRKKKLIEPEIEVSEEVEIKESDAEAIDAAPVSGTLEGLEQNESTIPQEDIAQQSQSQEVNQEQNVDLVNEAEIAQEVAEESKDEVLESKETRSDTVESVKAKSEKESQGDAANKFKKKTKKVKPKREEIIDEDTLEELRKAFRVKLPGKRREYLVEGGRSKPRPASNNARNNTQRERTANKGFRSNLRSTPSSTGGDVTADIAPFSAKSSKRVIKIGESINVGEIAKLMSVKAGELIRKLITMGVAATINQTIDHETAILLAEEFGFEVVVDIFEEEDLLLEAQIDTTENELFPRPPVVTVMGHVDHGKTTLLDTIRKAKVVEGEAGGITQHIGAYSVEVNGKTVAFVDTPGHEAFTAMRARGAKVTDVVILVVAADDGVMPQTVEAVNHAKAAEVPIIVAVNKIDKPDAEPEKIKRELSEIGLLSEDWGGDTLFAEVSAKQNTGITELLELILLQADILELKADIEKRANGFVIEAILDKGRGPVATVIVSEGTLRVGDIVLAGTTYGRVRALTDDKGERIKEAGPSIPVGIMGLSGIPQAGDRFYVVEDEKAAKEVVAHRETKQRETVAAKVRKPSLENLFEALEEEEAKELALIIKADTQGSVEAVRESITKLSTDKCLVKIVHTGVGGINETDVILASASNAIIVGFNVRPDVNALELSEREGISLELHTIIYNLIDRVRGAMEGLLDPIIQEKITGHAEIRETFHISRIGTIAGCMVNDGKVARDSNVKILRDSVVIFDGKLSSLKRFKDDAKEVNAGYECGITIERFNDLKVGDTFEFYMFEEFKQEL
ncbi:MAG: translation initiation factor IF-2 [Deltaproteobacteria bacterium]|nr:translation initiation factor IF-2 [Deltaproteobacteria bacterium]